MSVENTVKSVMDSYGIPSNIWRPIMSRESSGNPAARNITSDEHSIGLFQINIVANPGYIGQDLTDPTVNATIAARDFISPAYEKSKSLFPGDEEAQAVYTYKEGIRPYWTSDLEESFRDSYRSVAGAGSSLPSPGLPELNPDRGTFGRSGGNLADLSEDVKLGFWDNLGANILTCVGFLVLFVVGFVAVLQLFPEASSQVTDIAKKVGGM